MSKQHKKATIYQTLDEFREEWLLEGHDNEWITTKVMQFETQIKILLGSSEKIIALDIDEDSDGEGNELVEFFPNFDETDFKLISNHENEFFGWIGLFRITGTNVEFVAVQNASPFIVFLKETDLANI